MSRSHKFLTLAAAGFGLAAASILFAGTAEARSHFSVSIGLGVPVIADPSYYAPPPVYYAPAPVYVAPAPVYYAAPAYYPPRPAYYAPRPVYYAPHPAYGPPRGEDDDD